MLILFDHGTPKGLARALSGHTVYTAQSKGWDTLSNGALLNAAEAAGFELLLTTDRRIRHRKNLQVRRDAWQLRRSRDSLQAEVTELVRFTCAVYHATGRKSLKARGELLVTLTFASWNQIADWFRRLEGLRRVA